MSKKRNKKRIKAVYNQQRKLKAKIVKEQLNIHRGAKNDEALRVRNIIKMSKNGLEVETKSQHQKDFEAGNCVETNISSIKKLSVGGK